MKNKFTFLKKGLVLFCLVTFLISNSAWAGIRPDINDASKFSQSDRETLAKLLVQFACNGFYGGGVVSPMDYHAQNMCEAHTMGGQDCLPFQDNCNGVMVNQNFLPWHRTFIADLEGWLLSGGNTKFVPLPAWNPCDPIPAEFMEAYSTCEGLTPPQNEDIDCGGFPENPYTCTDFCDYAQFCEFSNEIEGFHDGVHNFVGGSMPDMAVSAGTAIFYIWHAWLDDVYLDYQVAHAEIVPEDSAIEISVFGCGVIQVKLKDYDCLESVSWSVEGGAEQVPIPTMDSYKNGVYYAAFCTALGPPPYSIEASLSTGCGVKTISYLAEGPSCDIEVVEESCEEVELRFKVPGRFFTAGEWSIESPGYIIEEYYENGYYVVHVGATQPGIYTVTVTGVAVCSLISESIDVQIGEQVSLPPFTPIELCGSGLANVVCYDLSIYSGLTGFIINDISANMGIGYPQNETELCLYANTESTTFGSITITPIGICGEGEPVTWTIRINDKINCGGLEGNGGPRMSGQGSGNPSFSNLTGMTTNPTEIKISPNPFQDEIRVSLGKLTGENLGVKIFNVFGMEVAATSGKNLIINSQYLMPGVYFVQVLDERNKVLHIEKLIKQ